MKHEIKVKEGKRTTHYIVYLLVVVVVPFVFIEQKHASFHCIVFCSIKAHDSDNNKIVSLLCPFGSIKLQVQRMNLIETKQNKFLY